MLSPEALSVLAVTQVDDEQSLRQEPELSMNWGPFNWSFGAPLKGSMDYVGGCKYTDRYGCFYELRGPLKGVIGLS